MKTKYRADVLRTDQPAHIAPRTDPAILKILGTIVQKGSWVNKSSAFSVAKINSFAERRVQTPSFIDGRLAVPLYLTDGLHRRTMSQTVENSRTD